MEIIQVHLISVEQKNLLINQIYFGGMYFNPTKDKDGFWFISVEEVEQCELIEFNWIKDLPLIHFNPYYEEI